MHAAPGLLVRRKYIYIRLDRESSNLRHCGPTGRRKAPSDDRLRDAIQKQQGDWIASSLALLAMTSYARRCCLAIMENVE
jgi:hypothetical protein